MSEPIRLDPVEGHLDAAVGPGGSGSRSGGGRNRVIAVFIGLLVVAFGFIVVRGLGDAALFFYNADEALEQREDLGDSRFRLQGRVVPDSVSETVDADGAITVEFSVAHGDAVVPVSHQGDPPDLFKDGIPVVLEGHWQGDIFTSNRMLVKHEEVYTEENPTRVDQPQP